MSVAKTQPESVMAIRSDLIRLSVFVVQSLAEHIPLVITGVDPIIEPSQFKLLLAISRRPIPQQSFLHFSARTRCDWDFILAGGKGREAETYRDAKSGAAKLSSMNSRSLAVL